MTVFSELIMRDILHLERGGQHMEEIRNASRKVVKVGRAMKHSPEARRDMSYGQHHFRNVKFSMSNYKRKRKSMSLWVMYIRF